jgi:hypothetical protein
MYVNLVEHLPDCFKTSEDTESLLKMIDAPVRLLSDDVHLCSETFLKRCLDLFVKPSEEAALKKMK